MRSRTDFQITGVNNKDFGIESMKSFSKKLLDIAPNEIKQCQEFEGYDLNTKSMGVWQQVNEKHGSMTAS